MFGRISVALGQRNSHNREGGFCLVYFNRSQKDTALLNVATITQVGRVATLSKHGH